MVYKLPLVNNHYINILMDVSAFRSNFTEMGWYCMETTLFH